MRSVTNLGGIACATGRETMAATAARRMFVLMIAVLDFKYADVEHKLNPRAKAINKSFPRAHGTACASKAADAVPRALHSTLHEDRN